MNKTKRSIMEAAIETIMELGFAQASIGQIAKRAGISKGVITYHFPSKDELIDFIVTELYTDGAEFLSQIMQEQTASGMLRSYIESNLAFIRTNPRHVAAVAEIILNMRTEDGKLRYVGLNDDPILVPLIEIIQWGQREGEFREFTDFGAKVLAMTIRGTIDGTASLMMSDPRFDFDLYTAELITLFERATCKMGEGNHKEDK
ncbi:TetR family transcriptional regulator [Paenibacillus donghaensis]|uniref:TetR/AcrR family transcriptional regulator n=1 Tax=Paenibacillus donghaensis TaxID=414771 RepID=UPI0018842505|nr:TetR/AcrR family transcriptional regulator [Paenibacillus donghaensis]MBE9915887.1 TetR family transcriptional regulator [Paenibacillus donghaensis]